MEPRTHLAHLRADVDAMITAATDGASAPVRACPGWSVGDLLAHTAGVYCFATAQLRADPGRSLVPFDPAPEGDPVDVLRTCADDLLAALEATDPTEHRPNWAGELTSAFWFRRMAMETVVHRADVELAVGQHVEIDPALAVDGVDELCDTFLAHAGPRGIVGTGETVHLHATDDDLDDAGPGEWMFTFTPEGVAVEHRHDKGDMAGRGSAADLLLFVWNRRPVSLECFGEPDLLTWWPERVRI